MFSFLYYTSGNDIGELHTYIEEYKDEFEKLGEEDEVGKVVFNNVIAKLGDIDTITYEDIIGIIVNNKHYEVHETQVNNLAMTSSFKHITSSAKRRFSFKLYKTYNRVAYRQYKTLDSLSKCLIYMFSYLCYISGNDIEVLHTFIN